MRNYFSFMATFKLQIHAQTQTQKKNTETFEKVIGWVNSIHHENSVAIYGYEVGEDERDFFFVVVRYKKKTDFQI